MFSPAERRVVKRLLGRFDEEVKRDRTWGAGYPVINIWEFSKTDHRYLRSALKKLERKVK